MINTLHRRTLVAALVAAAIVPSAAWAQKQYGPGVSDTEIKIGNIMPYSGPASAYSTIGKMAAAYFEKINSDGGVYGRKIKFLSNDDGYNPAKSLEEVRKLVEQEEVLAIFLPLGTPTNVAIQKYLNAKKVPHLFVGSGATRWGDIKDFPWTVGFQPTLQAESKAFAQHVLRTNPAAKIAVLMQNDELGKDHLKGLNLALGDKAKSMIVAQQSYESTDPTIDSQLVALKASGADTLMIFATTKFAAMAIKKTAEIGWTPNRYLASVSASVSSVLKPAGVEASKGIYSATYIREPDDAATQATKEYQDYAAVMNKYYPAGDPTDSLNVIAYSYAQALVQTLRQAGDQLTRENVMKQALSLNMSLPMLYPGIKVQTSATDGYPIEEVHLIQFNGKNYQPVKDVPDTARQ
ncbi:ABC-type branched-chain amino acid transport system, periplasmic component [Variovorax sp. CF313]|uniref:ABC transporter substrate-binding protein n=1 Tax=Variovorax sp. CF313 TaxID=1144315 RepID=UPI0002713E79|nr:ABC transporter substrate-binding protein [Variovorax sp. CF313]EJL73755.1 ABC-type branched-chain amino acid transport system, periplasmic component [Variovorax sp. CF313]